MIELELPHKSHMGGWFIDEKICDDIVQSYLENSSKADRGNIYKSEGLVVDLNEKDSFDMCFHSDTYFYPYSEYLMQLYEVLKLYLKKYPYVDHLDKFGIKEKINIQKYPPGGGYKKWHFEEGGSMNRCLVFMTYLNDVTDEGGTEFFYQGLKLKPQKGLTVI